MEVEIRNCADGQLGTFAFLAGFGIEQPENASAVLIHHYGKRFAVLRKRHFVDVPRNVAGEHCFKLGEGIKANEPLKLSAFVAQDVNGFAVGRESGLRVGDLLLAFRRDELLAAGFGVDNIEIALVDGDVFGDEQFRIVVRPILNRPAGGRNFEQHMIRIGPDRIHDANVGVLAVSSG